MDTVKNGSNILKAFTYDGNGNATKTDTKKTIVYNMFNLPQQVNLPGSMLATYYYDSGGNKLRDVSKAGGTWDYKDGIIYKNGQVQFIQTEEGSATLSSDSITYNYITELKDYLGNVRASYDNGGTGGTARLIQENDYFPFGLSTSYYDLNSKNRYLYNGKELQIDLTGQYDYGARFYDPVIGRWNVVDKYAEHPDQINLSPYAYVGDRPINITDPDGNCPPCDLQGQPTTQQSGQCSSCNLPGSPVKVTPTPSEIPKFTLNSTQEAMDEESDAAGNGELTGLTISEAGAPEAGAPIIAYSATVGAVTSTVSASIDLVKGDYAKGFTKLAAQGISEATGGLIKNSTAKEDVKVALNAAKVVVGKLVDKAIGTLPSNSHEKISTTMQRSSIPKPPVVAPKPLLKTPTT